MSVGASRTRPTSEQERRAREAVLRRLCCHDPSTVWDLVAIIECSSGLCPRHGRTIVGGLIAGAALAKVAKGVVTKGARFVPPAVGAA